MRIDPNLQIEILKKIKLKDRLYKFLETRKAEVFVEPKWVPCRKCQESVHEGKHYPGWVLMHPRYPGIHPSQIGGACLLKIYNEIIGKPGHEKFDFRLQLIFDLGHAVHHMFQGYGLAGAWGPHYVPETPVNGDHSALAEELMVEGSADADNIVIITDIPGYDRIEVGVVHEYKSCNSNVFKKLTSPKPEHKQQALLYSAALNRPVVVFLYFNKDDSNIVEFPVQFDPAAWSKLEQKTRVLKDSYLRQVPPEGEAGFHCQYCGYAYDCDVYRRNQPVRR